MEVLVNVDGVESRALVDPEESSVTYNKKIDAVLSDLSGLDTSEIETVHIIVKTKKGVSEDD